MQSLKHRTHVFFQLKLSWWKAGTITAYIIFNTKGKNATKWFVNKRVKETSWSTLKFEPSFSKFHIRGFVYFFDNNTLLSS